MDFDAMVHDALVSDAAAWRRVWPGRFLAILMRASGRDNSPALSGLSSAFDQADDLLDASERRGDLARVQLAP
jgi:hypothetical protein